MISRKTVLKNRKSDGELANQFLDYYLNENVDNCFSMLDYTQWKSARYKMLEILISEFPKLREKNSAVDLFLRGVYGRFLERRSGVRSEEKDEFEEKNGHYTYVPADQRTFLLSLLGLKNKFPHLNSFIDVGSGMGDKVFLANLAGFEYSTGVEYNKHTYELSTFFKEEFLPDSSSYDISFLNGDAFNEDFSEYDLIYLYVPMHSSKIRNLWAKILNEMNKDAVIYEYTGITSLRNILRKADSIDYFEEIKLSGGYYQEALVKIREDHKKIVWKDK